jgi:ABC-type uncharacterized transport system substrate-binding protein
MTTMSYDADMKGIIRHAAAALSLLVVASSASAHPHVFAAASVEVRFGARGLEGVRIGWTFDEMFSSMVLQEYDRQRTGRLTPAAVRDIEQKQMEGLKEFSYFVALAVNGTPVRVTAIRDFTAELVNHQLVYHFTVPMTPPAPPTGTIEIHVDDPTWFTAFSVVEPVRVQTPPAYDVSCQLARDPQTKRPEGIKCAYRRRSP